MLEHIPGATGQDAGYSQDRLPVIRLEQRGRQPLTFPSKPMDKWKSTWREYAKSTQTLQECQNWGHFCCEVLSIFIILWFILLHTCVCVLCVCADVSIWNETFCLSFSNMSTCRRQHWVQLSSHQWVRDHQEETQVVPGLPLHEVSDCWHAEGG